MLYAIAMGQIKRIAANYNGLPCIRVDDDVNTQIHTLLSSHAVTTTETLDTVLTSALCICRSVDKNVDWSTRPDDDVTNHVVRRDVMYDDTRRWYSGAV